MVLLPAPVRQNHGSVYLLSVITTVEVVAAALASWAVGTRLVQPVPSGALLLLLAAFMGVDRPKPLKHVGAACRSRATARTTTSTSSSAD